MMRIGLLGCGNIGHIIAQHAEGFEVSPVYDKVYQRAQEIAELSHGQAYEKFESFLNADIDIVVEAASVSAVKVYAKTVLSHRKNLVIMSVGVLADPVFRDDIHETAKNSDKRSISRVVPFSGLTISKSARFHP